MINDHLVWEMPGNFLKKKGSLKINDNDFRRSGSFWIKKNMVSLLQCEKQL